MKYLFNNKKAWTIILYLAFLCLLLGLIRLFLFPDLLKETNFLNWDAEHYNWIKKNGYAGFRIAFFPLFPIVWYILSCGIYSMALINALVFLISYYLLIKLLNLSTLEIVLYLSIPSFIFFYLPYTESLFFATSTLTIYGVKKEKTILISMGIFLCALTRPSFIFLIPAVIFTEILYEKLNTKSILRILSYIIISLIGLAIVFGIHSYYTGNWFAYFEISKGWGGVLHFPILPYTSWGGGLIVRLDGASMLFGIFSGILLLSIYFKASFLKNTSIPKEVIFSLIYLCGITLFIMLRGGTLFSLNRFIFACPFIIIAFNFWTKLNYDIKTKELFYIFGSIILFWLLLGSYVHIQTFLKYFLLSIYVSLIFVIKLDNFLVRKLAFFLLITLNITFQIILYVRFLNGNWVG
ncbi:MAG: hypothetical protein IPP32_15890 [Bacteroidetes bacterium]|nr:hypothetical protein [Bacteroidota bacterium]